MTSSARVGDVAPADVVRVRHDEAVARAFPGHRTGLLRVSAAGPLAPLPGAIDELVARAAAPGGCDAAERASLHWRSVYERLGAKPKYRSSVERLLDARRAGASFEAGIPLVDLYCWYSLVAGVPIGGYRLARVEGALTLGLPGKGMRFTPLGATRGTPERTRGREVAFYDETKVLCRYWNFRDCDETKLAADVADVLFVFDLADGAGQRADDAEGLVRGLGALLDGDVAGCAVLGPETSLDTAIPPC